MSDARADGINPEKYGHRTARHVWLWATAPFRQAELGRTDPTKPAIYFIHGTADWASSGIDIAKSIPESSYSKFHLVSFKNRLSGKDIESFSIQLAHKIRFENDKDVILIGHSRGGLVSTHYAVKSAEKQGVTVRSVIAITTPYQGSHLAKWPLTCISDSVVDYQEGSAFLTDLHLQKEISTPHVFIAAQKDWLVNEQDSYLTNVSESCRITIENENHLSVMHSEKLLTCVKQKLEEILSVPQTKSELPVQEDKSGEDLVKELEGKLGLFVTSSTTEDSDRNTKAIKNLPELARASMPLKSKTTDYRNWELGVELAIERIQDPTNELSRKILSFHATHFVPGHSVAWKRFAGVLAILASVVVGSLLLAGFSPLIAGLSVASLYIGTSTLFAAGAALIYHGRQKSLSYAYSQLAACEDVNPNSGNGNRATK